jgi:hypothetical protein
MVFQVTLEVIHKDKHSHSAFSATGNRFQESHMKMKKLMNLLQRYEREKE